MVARTLITTADERTWPSNSNEPVLFLGEWCRRYSRKETWQRMDAEVLSYHWDDRKKLQNDYVYLQELHELLLEELSVKLNQIHSVDHSNRYWRILIGPWLGFFVQILFDRWYMLGQAVNYNKSLSCNVLSERREVVIPQNMSHFKDLCIADEWNQFIFSQIINNFYFNEVAVNRVGVNERCNNKGSIDEGNKIRDVKKNLYSAFVYIIEKIGKLVVRNDEYFFMSTYLYLISDLRAQIKLKQVPKVWKDVETPWVTPEKADRQWKLSIDSVDDKFLRVACEMIPENIPVCFLEGYKALINCVDGLPWPEQPKGIFTSNAHISSDVFKAWAAEKTELDIPLIIGQHGGHYGMTPWSFHENHEITIADRWLSWGWFNKHKKNIVPFGNLIVMGNDNVSHEPKGNALMVQMALPRYSYNMYAAPVASQWLSYYEDQCSFIEALPINIRKYLLVRAYPKDYGWDFKERMWNDLPDISIDFSGRSIVREIKKCRIYISTYNATTYLESLAWDIPTIIFWDTHYWELSAEAEVNMQQLKAVGIFHDDPISAAEFMVKIWDDIDGWWRKPEVQEVRKKFCRYYSYIPKDPIDKLVMEVSRYDKK